MTTPTPIQTPHAPAAIGPYSQAIRLGDFLFCSGQIPLNPETMTLEKAEIVLQTQRVLKNLSAVLQASNASFKNVVKTTVFLTDLGNFDAFNKEYSAHLEKEGVRSFPARSTIQVSALPKGSLIEIEAIAHL